MFVSGFHILYTLSQDFVLYPTNIQVTPWLPIVDMLLVCSFTNPASTHVRNYDTNFGTLPIQLSYQVSVFPSCVATVNTYRNIAVCKVFLHNLCLIFNDTCALFIIARTIPTIVNNATSDRWSLCGVAFPIYSNYRFNFKALLFSVFSSLVFLSALPYPTIFTGWPFCFHFLKHLNVGSIMPFLVS